jgi:hypothetical protein
VVRIDSLEDDELKQQNEVETKLDDNFIDDIEVEHIDFDDDDDGFDEEVLDEMVLEMMTVKQDEEVDMFYHQQPTEF